MKKAVIILLAGLLINISCNSNKHKEGNLIVKGQIKGLRLGHLLLKQIKKDSFNTIDSINVDGNENFIFYTDIDQPQIMLLELPEVKDGRILFFAAPGDTIDIFSYVESFGISPRIKGGVNQNKRNEYDKMIKQFNNKELDLIKERFDAAKAGYNRIADSLNKRINSLQKKRKLYALNFIFNNKDKAIGPYIAMMEFYDNPKALDTVYKVLTDEVKQSVYGKEIQKILSKKP
jgi:hypothetical protein